LPTNGASASGPLSAWLYESCFNCMPRRNCVCSLRRPVIAWKRSAALEGVNTRFELTTNGCFVWRDGHCHDVEIVDYHDERES
jgi:hypothetical protein